MLTNQTERRAVCVCVHRGRGGERERVYERVILENDITAEQTDLLICFLFHLNSDKSPLLNGKYVTVSLSPLDFTHIPEAYHLTPECIEQDVETTSLSKYG